MNIKKLINNNFYLFILIILTIFNITRIYPNKFIIFLNIVILSLPILSMAKKSKYLKSVILFIFIQSITLIIIATFFKKIRDKVADPEIQANKIIGYAHYYGYPILIDTFLFHLIIFLPALILTFLLFRNNK